MSHRLTAAAPYAARLVVVALLAVRLDAGISTTGSVWPTIPGDGVVPGELQIGVSFQSTGQVDVDGDSTLNTQQRVFLGYTVASTGVVNVTGADATWLAEGGVFLASQFAGQGHATITGGLWDVDSNVQIAQGDNSEASVTLNNGATWDTLFGVKICDSDNAVADININDGEWIAQAGVTVGGDWFFPASSVGTIHVNSNGTLTIEYGLLIWPGSGLVIDGGDVSLTGSSTFKGSLACTPAGGTLRVLVGETAGGTGLVELGDGVDLTNLAIDVAFHPDVAPDAGLVYDAFDAVGAAPLATLLAAATAITTPTDWTLNPATGELGFVAIYDALTGPDAPASQARQDAYDADGDADVDLRDLSTYQANYLE